MAVVDNAAGITIDASGQHMNSKVLDGLPAASATGQAVRYDEAVVTAGTHAFTAVQSGVDPTSAPNLTTRAYVDLGIFPAEWCTTAALPAYTYANGTAGVGATITGNANAAIGTVDGGSPAVGEHVLVNNGAAFSDNGLYIVTAVGDGATTPYVLTRSARNDTQAKILSTTIKVIKGVSRRSAVYEYCNNTSITIGTTALAWLRVDTMRSMNEVFELKCDFNTITVAPTNGQTIPGEPGFFFTITGTGASTAIGVPAAHTENGILTFGTGTTTTGLVTASNAATNRPLILDSSQFFEMEIKVSGPDTLSDGTNTFRMILGIADNIALGSITNGVYIQYTQGTSTSWLGTNRASSSDTNATGSTVAAGVTTYRRFLCRKYAGESTIHWYDANSEMTSSPTSGLPLGTNLTPVMSITKSAGTTSRSFNIDSIRILQGFINGRAA